MLDPQKTLPPPSSHRPSHPPTPTGPTPPGNVTSTLPAPPGSAPLDGLLGIGHNAPSPAQDPRKAVFADPPLLLSPTPWKVLAKQVETLHSLPVADREELLPPGYRVQLQVSPVVPELLRTIPETLPALTSREQLMQVIEAAGDESASENGGKPQLIIGETHHSAAGLPAAEAAAKLCKKYGIGTICIENAESFYILTRPYIKVLANALGIDPYSLNTEAGRRAAYQLALQKESLNPPVLYELLETILRIKIFESMGIKVAHIDRLNPDDPQRDAAMAKNIDQVRRKGEGVIVVCGARHAPRLQGLLRTVDHPPIHTLAMLAEELPRHPSNFGYDFENSALSQRVPHFVSKINDDAKKFGVNTHLWRVPGNFEV